VIGKEALRFVYYEPFLRSEDYAIDNIFNDLSVVVAFLELDIGEPISDAAPRSVCQIS
jgi:hypothetical protein